MSAPELNGDYLDLLEALQLEGVRYLLVGAFALAGLGVSRLRASGRPKDLLDIELLREAGVQVD